MLSKLINAEKRVRSNGEEFYVCTFSYTQGDTNASTFITIGGVKVLNPNAAAIRTVNLVKCLFPTEDNTALAYKKLLNRFIKCMESESKQYTTNKGETVTLESCQFSLPLIYVTLPVSEVFGVSKLFYADSNGEQKELTTLNAVGYSMIEPVVDETTGEIKDYKDTNKWDETLNGGSIVDVITRNANNNVANGTYWFEKKVADNGGNETIPQPTQKPNPVLEDEDE